MSNYCEIRENDETKPCSTKSLKGNPKRLAEGLKLKLADDGQVQLPESLQNDSKHQHFVPAFQQYMVDGGITAFKKVIQTEIANSVRDATCREVKKLELGLIDDLKNCLENAKEGGLDERNCDLAYDWSFVFLEIADHLVPGRLRQELTKIAAPLFEGLWGHLLPNINENMINQVREAERKPGEEDQWVGLHKTVTEGMSRDCRRDMPQIVQAYANAIERLLKQKAKRRPKLNGNGGNLEVPQGFDPLERFRAQIREEVNTQAFFESDLAILEEPIPIVNPLDPTCRAEIATSEYLVVMRRKVETLCYRILSKMRILFARECQRIQRQLSLRSRVRNGPDVLDAEKLTAALKHLNDAGKCLETWHSEDFVEAPE